MTPHATSIRTLESSVPKQCSYLPSIVYTLEGTIKDLCGFKATVICRYKVYMEIYKDRAVTMNFRIWPSKTENLLTLSGNFNFTKVSLKPRNS